MTDLVSLAGADGWERIADLTVGWLDGHRSRSEHTTAAYRRDLESWLGWCRANGVDPIGQAWMDDVLRWQTALKDGDPQVPRRPEAGTTRARRLAAVSSWYQYLIRHRVADRNPALLLRSERPVASPRHAPALSRAQVEKLLALADADANPRTAAIAWLLFTTAVRVGELIAANISDRGQDTGISVLHIHGKGGKTRPVEIEPHTWHRLEAYLATRTDVDRRPVLVGQAGAVPERPLIATEHGNRIDRKEVRRVLLRLARAAGLPAVLVDHLTPHSTRATVITAALGDGAPLQDVQDMAGHASPVTTRGYDRSRLTAERSPARRVARLFGATRLDAQLDAEDPALDA